MVVQHRRLGHVENALATVVKRTSFDVKLLMSVNVSFIGRKVPTVFAFEDCKFFR